MSDLELSPTACSLKPGIYEHFKGKRYRVLGVGRHSETPAEMVIYKALYGQGLIWVRPLAMFSEKVEVEREPRPRFKYIGEE